MENKLDLEQFEGHYPGPYIAEHGCVYYDGGNGEVAQVDLLANMTEDEYEATTRLLAAAPDLLAELKESRKEVEELRESNEVFRDWNDELQRLLNDSIDGQKEAAELRGRITEIAQNALMNTEKDNGGPGCCESIADILALMEGKQ